MRYWILALLVACDASTTPPSPGTPQPDGGGPSGFSDGGSTIDAGAADATDAASGDRELLDEAPTVEPMRLGSVAQPGCAGTTGGGKVVWVGRNGPGPEALFAASIAADGTVASESRLLLTTQGAQGARVVAVGQGYAVVWAEGTKVKFGRLSAANAIEGVVDLGQTSALESGPAIASNGTDVMVTWLNDIEGSNKLVRLNGLTGGVLNSATYSTTGATREPNIAWNGAEYFVSYLSGGHLYGRHFSIEAASLDANAYDITGDPIGVLTANGEVVGTALAGGGGTTVVSWTSGRKTKMRRYTRAGGGLNDATTVGDGTAPAVAFDGTQFVIAMSSSFEPGPVTRITALRMDAAGTVSGTPVQLAASGNDQTNACLVPLGTTTLATWAQKTNELRFVGGGRLVGSTTPDSQNMALVSRSANSQESPNVASDGTNHLIVYRDYRDLLTRGAENPRVMAALSTNAKPFVIANGTNDHMVGPHATFDGTDYLVVWRSQPTLAMRVSASGALLNEAALSLGDVGHDALAFGGGVHLAVWQNAGKLYAARISKTGTNLDIGGLTLDGDAGAPISSAHVAFDGAGFVVVWRRENTIRTTRVLPDGSFSPSKSLEGATHLFGSNLDVACLGVNCVVAWPSEKSLRWAALKENVFTDGGDHTDLTDRLAGVKLGVNGGKVQAAVLSQPESQSAPGQLFRGNIGEALSAVQQGYFNDFALTSGPLFTYSQLDTSSSAFRIHLR